MKQKIIDATIDIGAKWGLSKVSNNSIAAECGVTSASIYYHFKNKYNLIWESAMYASQAISQYIDERLDKSAPLSDQYRQSLYLTAEYFKNNRSVCLYYTRALTASDYIFTQEDRDKFGNHCPVCSLIAKGVNAGVFRGDTGKARMALVYYPLCIYMYMNYTHDHEPEKPHLDSFIEGMCLGVII